MIDSYEIERYGPIKKVSGVLTPLHAFIGPNDSGKSSLLRALVTGINAFRNGPHFRWPAMAITVRAQEKYVQLSAQNTPPLFNGGLFWHSQNALLVRFEADRLREPSGLLTEETALSYVFGRGAGLPGVFDLLHGRNEEILENISREFARLFPTVKRLRVLPASQNSKMIVAALNDGSEIPAEQMSEGMLYYLAYAALPYLRGATLLAVEEPENGLHPARIAQVVSILRGISERGMQVLLATHSPFVINEMKPDEVSVVTRSPDAGTKVVPIADTPRFAERLKTYNLGELWVSYANGLDEAPLLKGEAAQ